MRSVSLVIFDLERKEIVFEIGKFLTAYFQKIIFVSMKLIQPLEISAYFMYLELNFEKNITQF